MSGLALRTSGLRWVGVLEAATAVAAVGGGIGLMVTGLGMPDRDAPRLLGGTWRLPGLALISPPQINADRLTLELAIWPKGNNA